MIKALLYFTGIVNLLGAIFHMGFWSLLDWQNELQVLSKETRGILQVENIIIIYITLFFSAMSFIILRHGKLDYFARIIVLLMIGFYMIRLIIGYPFFGFSLEELMVWILSILIIASYTTILLKSRDLEAGV